jgi:hypothetical protein
MVAQELKSLFGCRILLLEEFNDTHSQGRMPYAMAKTVFEFPLS